MKLLNLFKSNYPQQYEEFTKVTSKAIPIAVEKFFKKRKQRVTRIDRLLPKTVFV